MRYHQLGLTDIKVSEISLGTAALTQPYGFETPPSKNEAKKLLKQAIELGINLIDTAPTYSESEQLVGDTLRESSLTHTVNIATKLRPFDDATLTDKELHNHINISITGSMIALRKQPIDILYLHHMPTDHARVYNMLSRFQYRGDFRHLGISVYTLTETEAALATSHYYDVIQFPYNALLRNIEAIRTNSGLVARSIYHRGTLTHRYPLPPPHLASLQSAARILDLLANTNNMTLPELTLRYVLSNPTISTALIGTTNFSELQSAANWSQKEPLPQELLDTIRTITVADLNQLDLRQWS